MISLNLRDQQMLDGQYGDAARLAMSIVVRMAKILEVSELMDVSQAHIDACGLRSYSGLEFVELLVRLGGKVVIPTTLNIIPLDLDNWEEQGISEEYSGIVQRMASAYLALGCIPTWTCAPYQGYLTPRFGQQIAWAESNAIVYANSVLGARTERYADFMDICAALTGRVPKFGLHIKANRRGQILFRLVGFDRTYFSNPGLFPVLGYLVGKIAQDRIPVIEGIPDPVSNDRLKAFGAASASSGAVGIFHMVGITPEAATLEEAFQGEEPQEVIEIQLQDLENARRELSTTLSVENKLDAVLLGCPHFSYDEFVELAKAIDANGQRLHPEVRFIVMTNHATLALLKRSDHFQIINRFGTELLLDSCVFHTPILSKSVRVIMTNSGKNAYYSPGELGVDVVFGNISSCVHSAVQGVVCLEN